MTDQDSDTAIAELATSITDRPHLSWSQFQKYQLCPLSYAFQYVDQAEPEFTPSSLVFGGAIHAAISMHHEAALEGTETPAVDKLVELIRDDLEPTGAPLRFNKGEDLDGLLALADRMLTAYIASDVATEDSTVLCIEESVGGSVDPDLPDISGKVDLVTLTQDGVTITDFKTTRASWPATKPEEHAGQLRLYGTLIEDRLGLDAPVSGLRFVTITKAKVPKVQVHAVEPSDEKLAAVVDQLREVWKGIVAGSFPARPGWPCGNCPFQSQCDAAIP